MTDLLIGLGMSAVAFVIIMALVIAIGRGVGYLFGPDK